MICELSQHFTSEHSSADDWNWAGLGVATIFSPDILTGEVAQVIDVGLRELLGECRVVGVFILCDRSDGWRVCVGEICARQSE